MNITQLLVGDWIKWLIIMRFSIALVCILALCAIVDAKCNKCKSNECECNLEIARGPPAQPFPFYKKKKCNVTRPLELKPKPDVCSCEQEYRIRPLAPENCEPKFAKSRSCECGFDQPEHKVKRKYPADIISRLLAIEYANKKDIPETHLYVHGRPVTPPPAQKREGIDEERLHKNHLHVVELKPAQRKRVHYRMYSSEETEGAPCHPKEDSYCDLCYGKVERREPKFDVLRQDGPACDHCQDRDSTEEVDETEEDFSTEPPVKHCSKCMKSKNTCDCPKKYDSYEDDYEEYECPFANRNSRSIRSPGAAESTLVV
ncbi:uncharacterized protein LOC131271662 [Anopheles coustani]|uniref:uncharacterized protein LOC131271662 n=2 Tax=coustani group TaxID=59130 RepID=UPI00265B31F4|nr:uncharacterized protein LOC131271662 [Anopheles coustani]